MKDDFDINQIVSNQDRYKISDYFYNETSIISFVDNKNKKVPDSWVKVNYKSYPRMNKVVLPKENILNVDFGLIFRNRKSFRKFNNSKISLDKLSSLLSYSVGVYQKDKVDWNNVRRFYPSAGARYPIETYIISNNVEGLDKGLYHYNVKEKCLELLLKSDLTNMVGDVTGQKFTKKAGVIVIFTGVLDRCRIKYQDRGMRYLLMECGHVMQNLYLVSESFGLGCCALGGFIDKKINELLDIEYSSEKALYMAAIGVKLTHESKKKNTE